MTKSRDTIRQTIEQLDPERMIDAFGFPKPLPLTRSRVCAALKLRGRVVRFLPPLNEPHFFTDDKNRTHPEGYRIGELRPPKLVTSERQRKRSTKAAKDPAQPGGRHQRVRPVVLRTGFKNERIKGCGLDLVEQLVAFNVAVAHSGITYDTIHVFIP